MSYCNINDAFNINSNFEKIIRGMNSFNPMNTFDNLKTAYNSNLNDSQLISNEINNNIYNDNYYELNPKLNQKYNPDSNSNSNY